MSDRINGVVVVLANDMRIDDAEATMNAMKQIKGVIEVKPKIVGPDDHIVATRMRVQFAQMLQQMANELLAE